MKNSYVFSSESVSRGHPDKVADSISDAILDAYLAQDGNAKVACEVLVTTGEVIIAGEVNSTATVDVESVARKVINEIGYNSDELGFNGNTCNVTNLMDQQSSDIAQGVDKEDSEEFGAGDQGIMFGYAENTNSTYMPLPITIANKLMFVANEKRENGEFKWARPDMKAQVTLEYGENAIKMHTVLMSVQHEADYIEKEFKEYIKSAIIYPVLESFNIEIPTDLRIFINPTGRFVIGGPQGDTGLTGRKIIVDTYGGAARHGGGAFSGKDSTKVDRSAAYMARYLAKNIVASGLAEKCEVQLAYAIGIEEPVSLFVDTFGTGIVPESQIVEKIRENISLTPKGIIDRFELYKPQFYPTSAYGHFGREDQEFAWEKTNITSLFEELNVKSSIK